MKIDDYKYFNFYVHYFGWKSNENKNGVFIIDSDVEYKGPETLKLNLSPRIAPTFILAEVLSVIFNNW